MSVNVIDTIKPKNNGSFPVVEAVDVKVSNTQRLDAALTSKANQSDLVTLSTTVAGKANQSDLNTLSAAVADKQNALTTAQLTAVNSGINSSLVSQINTNTTAIAGKASASDLATTNAVVASKADASDLTTATANLQSQIDEIVTPVTQDAEVQNARVDANGTSYTTLKQRIDATQAYAEENISEIEKIYNLIKFASVTEKTFIRNTGEVVSPAPDYFTLTVKAEANTSYAIDLVKCRFITYFNGDTFISGADRGGGNVKDTITTPANCDTICLSLVYIDSSTEEKDLYKDVLYIVPSSDDKYILINEDSVLDDNGVPSIKPIRAAVAELEEKVNPSVNDFDRVNMIDNVTVIEQEYINASGSVVNPAYDFFTLKFDITAETTYKVNLSRFRFLTFFNGTTFVSGQDRGGGAYNGTITAPASCDTMYMSFYYTNSSTQAKTMDDFKVLLAEDSIYPYDRLQSNLKITPNNNMLDYIDTTNRRKGCISFIFDDGCTNDSVVFDSFSKYGFACGFALPTMASVMARIDEYKHYYTKGFSILSHSTDDDPMREATESVATIRNKMIQSRRILENYGFKISGWVTPSSQLNSAYMGAVEDVYNYAYTHYFNPSIETNGYNTLSDGPWGLQREYLGTSLTKLKEECDNAIENGYYLTFYHHSRDMSTDLPVERLESLLEYLREKVDNCECEVLAPDLANRYYYRIRLGDIQGE